MEGHVSIPSGTSDTWFPPGGASLDEQRKTVDRPALCRSVRSTAT